MFRRRLLFLIVLLAAGIFYSKSPALSFVSIDLKRYVYHWYGQAQDKGLSYIKSTDADYPPFYLYILWMLTFVPIQKLYAIKIFSIIFNFFTAFMAYKIIFLRYRESSILPSLAWAAILFSPTVFLNSAMWGQCDIVYAFFAITALFQLMKSESTGSTVLSLFIYGLAISFKLQPVFLLPLFVIVLFWRNVSFCYLFIIPFVYFLTTIPALMVGKDMGGLISVSVSYFQHHSLTISAPNIYKWLPHWKFLFIGGDISCLLLVCFIVMKIGRYRNQLILSKEMILKLALFFSIFVPFLLPGMRSRYFFLADILSIIYAFYFPRYFYVPVCVNMASFFIYFRFLGFTWTISNYELGSLALLNLVALLTVGQEIWQRLFRGDKKRI